MSLSKILRPSLSMAMAASLLVALTGTAAADGHAMTGSGTGNVGGAHQQWNATLPANTDAELGITFWPCINPHAIDLEVYDASGLAGAAMQTGPCSKSLSWNTGAGGDVMIQMANYLHGIGTHWTITAEGFSLGEGSAMMAASMDDGMMADSDDAMMADDDAAMADDDAMMAEDDGEEAMMADDDAMMAEGTSDAMAPKVAMMGDDAMAGTLVGDVGGSFFTYDMPVTAGETYTLRMTNGLGVGGNWNGVGFKVWGPNGLVATSTTMHGAPDSVTFTADMDGTYQVQVYNYHHGETLYYAFDMGDDTM